MKMTEQRRVIARDKRHPGEAVRFGERDDRGGGRTREGTQMGLTHAPGPDETETERLRGHGRRGTGG